MGDEVAGFGTVYMMTEDGWEPLGYVADWDVELHAPNRPAVAWPMDFEETIEGELRLTRRLLLFFNALKDDRTYRNYIKSQKRSRRNAHAGR